MKEQYVCTVCGYNMVERFPKQCPFCGASRENFLTAAEVSSNYRVMETEITETVSMLRSQPALGFEHAAYRIATDNGVFWVDCPSTFDPSLDPVDRIYYTHHHFLGAGNIYQKHFKAGLAIDHRDAGHDLCLGYRFDHLIREDFSLDGLQAVHIDGHTPGFTIYRHGDVLLLCDYVFFNSERAKFNPYGPVKPTRLGGARIYRLLQEWGIRLVCGYDYAAGIDTWQDRFEELLSNDVLTTRYE